MVTYSRAKTNKNSPRSTAVDHGNARKRRMSQHARSVATPWEKRRVHSVRIIPWSGDKASAYPFAIFSLAHLLEATAIAPSTDEITTGKRTWSAIRCSERRAYVRTVYRVLEDANHRPHKCRDRELRLTVGSDTGERRSANAPCSTRLRRTRDGDT